MNKNSLLTAQNSSVSDLVDFKLYQYFKFKIYKQILYKLTTSMVIFKCHGKYSASSVSEPKIILLIKLWTRVKGLVSWLYIRDCKIKVIIEGNENPINLPLKNGDKFIEIMIMILVCKISII